MKVNVLIEKAESNWCASSNDECLHGCIAVTGDTREEAIVEFKLALDTLTEYNNENSLPVPEVTELELHELMPV